MIFDYFSTGKVTLENSSFGNYCYPLLKDTFESTRKSFYTLWCRMYINISVPWRFHADCKKGLVFFGGSCIQKMGFEANKIQGSWIRTTSKTHQISDFLGEFTEMCSKFCRIDTNKPLSFIYICINYVFTFTFALYIYCTLRLCDLQLSPLHFLPNPFFQQKNFPAPQLPSKNPGWWSFWCHS